MERVFLHNEVSRPGLKGQGQWMREGCLAWYYPITQYLCCLPLQPQFCFQSKAPIDLLHEIDHQELCHHICHLPFPYLNALPRLAETSGNSVHWWQQTSLSLYSLFLVNLLKNVVSVSRSVIVVGHTLCITSTIQKYVVHHWLALCHWPALCTTDMPRALCCANQISQLWWVYNVALCWLGGAHDDLSCSLSGTT